MSELDNLFNQYVSGGKANAKSTRAEFVPTIFNDDTQDVDTNKKDQQTVPQYVDIDKVPEQKFVAPERRSYFVAGNVNNNEINTTAQKPNEIEYEANVFDDDKKKDDYFALTKLSTSKTNIVKNAIKYITGAANPIQSAINTVGVFTGKDDKEIVLEGVRGFTGSTIDFASSLYRFFKQNTDIAKTYTKEQLDKIANLGNVMAGGESFADDIAQQYTEFYKQIDEENKILRDKTERFLQYTGIAKTDKDGFIYDLVGGGASLMYAIGLAAITKSPAAAAEMFGMYQYQSLYEEGIDRGFSPIKARAIGVAGGAFEGGLEMVGLHVLIETLKARRSFTKILKAALTEFTQEASQQGAEEVLSKLSGLREDSTVGQIVSNVFYAGVIGAILGGGSATVSNVFYKQISDSAKRELINNGMQSDDAKQTVDNVLKLSVSPQSAQEVVSISKDEQSPVTYKNADPRETYKETGEAIKKALDPEQKRGVELEFIEEKKKFVDTVAKALINSGKFTQEEAYKQAETQANLADGLARIGFEQDNIRPSEYYKRFKVDVTSGNIETDERNVDEDNPLVDVSFDPVDFDPQARAEYEAAMDAQQEEIDKLQKEFTMSLKDHAKFFSEIGIEAIRRPTPDGAGRDRWGEYKDLSPRIKNYFFSDDATMSWDDAEKLLAESSSPIKDLFSYLAKADETAKTYNQKAVLNKVLTKEKEDIKQKAIADGTFMKAPNGKDSNLPEQLWLTVRTKAFKSWFGDWINNPQNASKVVDANGEPLVVYHGTKADFSVFEGQRIKNTSEGAGFYFTPNKNLAQGFGNIKATFLNIRNPQYAYGNIDLVSDTYEEDYEKENKEAIDKGLQEVKKKLEKKGYKFYKQVQKDLFDVIGTQTQEVLDGLLYLRNFVENENFDEEKIYNDIREAEKEVFKVDGYTTNRYGGDQKVYVTFTSNQIKSINNRGRFDPRNANIYYQQGVQESTAEQKTKQKFNTILNTTAKDLVEVKTKKEIQDKLQKMFGTYEELDAYDEGEDNGVDKYVSVLANEYMAELEYSANERDYDAVQGLLDRLKKDVVEISKRKDYNNINEEKENSLSDTSRSGVLRTEKSAEGNLYSDSAKTDLQVKNLSIEQLKEINDNIVFALLANKDNSNMDYLENFNPATVKFVKANGIKNFDKNGVYVKGKKKEADERLMLDTNTNFYSSEDIENAIEYYENLGKTKEVEYYKKLLSRFIKLQDEFMQLQEKLRVYIAKNSPKQSPQQQSQLQLQADIQQPMLDIFYQAAYHGGPVDFDKFSTQYIGEGEGIQAHGWGLYFAQNKNTSEDYRKHLSTTDVFLNGKKITPLEKIKFSRFFDDGITNDITKAKNKIKEAVESKQQDVDYYNERIDLLQEGLSVVEKNKNKSIKEIIDLIPQGIYILSQDELDARIKRNAITVADIIGKIKNDIEKNEMELQYDEEELKLLKSFLDGEIKIKQGQLFKVDISEEDVLLDEQKTFDEQPKKVQEALKEIAEKELNYDTKTDFGKSYDYEIKYKKEHPETKDFNFTSVISSVARYGKERALVIEERNNLSSRFPIVKDFINSIKNINDFIISKNPINFNNYYGKKLKGKDIYNAIVFNLKDKDASDKEASLLLNRYGIKGITYDGQQDGRAYVIFDDKAVKVLEKYYQQQQEQPRGATSVFDRQYFINLFANADKSTLMHEMAHAWLSEINYFAKAKNATQKVLDLKKQLDNWLGVPDNNGRYSVEQQEKFAENFEIYLKEGKAPTAKLKTVFARFKTWLSEIYDRIKDDLPKLSDDVRELFDNILSRSYDVPDSNIYAGKEKAIKEVIKNIQEGRASEVDGITIDDVYNLLNMAYMRKPRRPNKNLKQLLNDKNIYDFNELNKAGADTVLQILKDGGYVKEDVTTEVAMDLARKALDGEPVYRLADQWRVAGDTDFARNLRVLERVIEFSQIDSTIEKILELQQEGYRNVEQGDVEQVQNDYRRLFSADVKEAKKIVENIINRLHKKRFIDRVAQKQMLVDLNFSSTVEEIRESVLNVIEDLQDEIKLVKEQLRNPRRKPIVRKDKTIPPAKDATEEEKNTYKKYMRKQINRLLKQALPRKQNQQKFSKFDKDTQDFFTDLEKYNKMTIEAAQEELYKRATSIIDEKGEGLNNFEKIKNMFLSYKANKINQNSTEFYKQLYDNLQEINVFGRNAKEIEETLKKEKRKKDIYDLIANIEKNKSETPASVFAKKGYLLSLGNWWSTINAIAGKKQADKDTLERNDIDTYTETGKITDDIKKKCAAAFGFKNSDDLDMTVYKYLNEKYTYEELDPSDNTTSAVKLSKLQLMHAYICLKNKLTRDRVVRAYGNIQIQDMMDKLTIQDKKCCDELQQSIADLYDDINKVYIKMYGLDMPQAENYFPSTVVRIQGNMDLLKDNIGQASSPGFIKARVQSNLPLMDFGNPFKIAFDHVAKVVHFINFQEKLADLNKVYKATKVERYITNIYGKSVYGYIKQLLDNVKFQNIAKTIDAASSVGDFLTNNYVLTKIAVKPSITVKQLLSCINYAEDMSSVQWFEGFIKGIRHYKKTIDFMMINSEYCKQRFAKGGQTEALLKAMEGGSVTIAKIKTMKGLLSWMTRVGDIGAIIFGGYPLVMDQVSKGVPLKKAIEKFEQATIRSQQASMPSTLSNWQYRGMNNWFMRAMFAFANTANQYSRKIGDTIYMYMHGDIDKKQFAKNMIIYGALNPLLYTSFTSLAILSGLVSGNWDDLKDDIIMSLMQCSNILSIPIIGQGYNYAVQRVILDNRVSQKEVPLLAEIMEVIDTLKKEDLETKDWLTVIDDVASLVFGVPAKTLYNTFVGSVKDFIDGEYGKFAVKLYGATESRADKIFD